MFIKFKKRSDIGKIIMYIIVVAMMKYFRNFLRRPRRYFVGLGSLMSCDWGDGLCEIKNKSYNFTAADFKKEFQIRLSFTEKCLYKNLSYKSLESWRAI